MKFVRQLVLVLFAAVVLLGAWALPPDAPAEQQVEQGLHRALASFAVARTLCAVLSLAEGTAVEAAPFGIGVELTPGRILQPLNELAEQFSTLMLAASVAFGIQLFLLKIGAAWLLSVLLSAVLLVWLLLRLSGADAGGRVNRAVSLGLLALLLVRFAVPLSALGSEAVFRQVLAEPQSEAIAAVERSGRELDVARPAALAGTDGSKTMGSSAAPSSPPSANPPAATDSTTGIGSLWDALRQKLPAVPHPAAALQRMRDAADRVVDQIVRLIAIFVVQTVVLPSAFLWVLAALGRALLGRPAAR